MNTKEFDRDDRAALHGPRNILCVDADDDARLLAAELLYEYEVDFALTGDDAVQLAHSRAYDLYLVDPAVPGCEDVDLLSDLRRFDTESPLVLCTSGAIDGAAAGNASAHIRKPCYAARLRQIIGSLLESRPRA